MFLTSRPARLADLPACLSCTRDLFAFDQERQRLLLEMWQTLLHDDCANFWVMEDLACMPAEKIAYFCVVSFFTEAFAAALKTGLPPPMTTQALAWWAEGRTPFLNLDEIRRGNADGGLIMACFQSGFRPGTISGDAGGEVRDKIPEIIQLTGHGYRVNECFFEAYGPFQREWAAMVGFQLCHDYETYYAALPEPPPAEQRVALFHLSRAQAVAKEGATIVPVFRHHPPQFGFRPLEQELLLWALSGMNDEELAEALGLAQITIRKRWMRVYERVQAAAPALLPREAGAEDARRGPEKRRRLLHYLRQHIEELRPVAC